MEEIFERVRKLNRKDYFDFYNMVLDEMHKVPSISIDELEKIKNGEKTWNYNPKIDKAVNKEQTIFNDDESIEFIRKVKASNVTDVSEAGYFYKMLANNLDDVLIVEEDCGCSGDIFDSDNISDEDFNFYVKDMNTSIGIFKDADAFRGHGNVEVFSPITCNNAKNRCFCKKCVGSLNAGGREFSTKLIGYLTTLCVTESSTQSCLSSMNKNSSMPRLGDYLGKKFPNCETWDDVITETRKLIEGIKGVPVEARWLLICILCRYFKDEKGHYSCVSLRSKFKFNEDKISSYIFNHTYNNFSKILNENKEINVTSAKTKYLIGF